MKYHPDTLPLLEAAWMLLMDEKNWTQQRMARDQDGICVEPRDVRAMCWCAGGAVEAVAPRGSDSVSNAYDALIDAAREQTPARFGIVVVNDHKGYNATMRMFERACEIVQEAQ